MFLHMSPSLASGHQALDPEGLLAPRGLHPDRLPDRRVPERAAHRRLDRQASLAQVRLGCPDQHPGVDLPRALVEDLSGAPEGEAVVAALRLDDLGVAEPLAQAPDPGLEVRLVLLGDVVVGVLLEVAELPGGLDPCRHLLPGGSLELGQLLVQRRQPLGRDRFALRRAHAGTLPDPAAAGRSRANRSATISLERMRSRWSWTSVLTISSPATVRSIRSPRPARTVSGPPITAEPESDRMLDCWPGVSGLAAASSGVGKRLGWPVRRRAIDSRDGPASQRACSSSSAAITATATIARGSSRYSEGWKCRR